MRSESSPYHNEIHLQAYDTSEVIGISGDAAFLSIELDNILYPSDKISPFATNISHHGSFFRAKFRYDFAPEDAIVASWAQERTVLEVVHTKTTEKLGWLANRSVTNETYDVKIRDVFLKRNAKPEEIVNEYTINRFGDNSQFYIASVKRSNFQLGNNSDFELMTQFDSDHVFDVICALHSAIGESLVFGHQA